MSEEKNTPQPRPEYERLAKLLTEQREAFGDTDKEFAARWTDAKDAQRSVIDWRRGLRAPAPAARADIEKGIGWTPGSISRLLSGEGVFLSLTDVQDLPEDEKPVKRASELTDDELAMEMMRRFKNYADLARMEQAPSRDTFDLAANNPGTPKRFKPTKN
jgi:hypothetical protein